MRRTGSRRGDPARKDGNWHNERRIKLNRSTESIDCAVSFVFRFLPCNSQRAHPVTRISRQKRTAAYVPRDERAIKSAVTTGLISLHINPAGRTTRVRRRENSRNARPTIDIDVVLMSVGNVCRGARDNAPRFSVLSRRNFSSCKRASNNVKFTNFPLCEFPELRTLRNCLSRKSSVRSGLSNLQKKLPCVSDLLSFRALEFRNFSILAYI